MASYLSGPWRAGKGAALSVESAADNLGAMAHERILVAGAGAIGSVIGAMLHRRGHRVTMLGRREHLEAARRDGLRISGLLGEHVARGIDAADDAARLDGQFDLILVTVKPYDTAQIADPIAARLTPGGFVVSLQNGLGNIEALAARFGIDRVIGGRVIFGAEMPSPGAAHVTVFADPVAIGPDPAQQSETGALKHAANEIAAILDGAGVPTIAVDDIMPVIWTKLLYNVALNPLGAIFAMSYGELTSDRDLRQIVDEVIEEAFAVSRRLGVKLPFADAAAYREVFHGRLIPSTASHRPTMLNDLRRRGRTDIDALNGKIVELGDKQGVAVTVNRALTRMIHAAERARHAEEK
jgi:2-dehydropantoate 2-reductase